MSDSLPVTDSTLLHALGWASAGLAVASLLVWLAVFATRAARLRRAALDAAAEEELTTLVLDQLAGYAPAADKLAALPARRRTILLRILQNLIEQTKGRDQANLIALLRVAGFADSAHRQLVHGSAAERQAACSVLGQFDDEASRVALHGALEDADAGVRLGAARALLHRDWIDSLRDLLNHLPFSSVDPPLALAEIFAHLPARLHAEAIAIVRDRALPPEWTRLLAIALAREQIFEAFDAIAALRHAPEPRVRAACWVALSELGDPRAGELAAEGLRDEAADVRQVAAQCAGKLGGPELLPTMAALRAQGSWWNRYHTARAVLDFGAAGTATLQAYLAGAPDDDPARQAWREREGGFDGR